MCTMLFLEYDLRVGCSMNDTEWNISVEKIDQPYADQWELMSDFMSLLDMRLYYMYKYHMWVGPENNLQNMIGLAVSN